MNAEEMIQWRMRSPFVPFDIRLRNGESVRVQLPTSIAIGRKIPECAIYESAERLRFVAYRDIAEVVMAPANGS